ncbi:MAG: hypothetical protein MZW92_79040 [Comamonadaceae bacterium]|nr:hypothetical protein [Comamonadaceae bacterium]
MKMRMSADAGRDHGRRQRPRLQVRAATSKSALDDAYSGLRELLSQFRKPHGSARPAACAGEPGRRVPRPHRHHHRATATTSPTSACRWITRSQVFYIIQEALANVTRHSGASQVTLTLEQRGNVLRGDGGRQRLRLLRRGQPARQLRRASRPAPAPRAVHHARARPSVSAGASRSRTWPRAGHAVRLVFPAPRQARGPQP